MSDKAIRKRIHKDLLNLVKITLSNPRVGPKIKSLLDTHNVSVEDLKKEVLEYTLKKGESGYVNDRYRRTVARLTLYFHNLVEGTYHQDRHRLVLSFLEKAQPKSITDIGYGVPGPYLISYLNKHPKVTANLLDQDPTAEEFARTVFNNEAPKLLSQVKFKVYDMNLEVYPGDSDVYSYLDSIEHTKNPSRYLGKMVKKAKNGCYFIFSIPIGSMKGLEGFHFAEWLTDDDARRWVKDAGLTIIDEGTAYPNPDVDYFAELCEGGYHNYLVLCKK